uniref:Uncharacterized protein n=1 Tax=Panagrolaimus superbus TaxID=310955 RepID=A0A914YAH3_9BILA
MFVYHNETEAKVLCFEVDDFKKCLHNLPISLDIEFENCYRLMRIIKLKGAELSRIYDAKKKRNEPPNILRMKTDVEELEKELSKVISLSLNILND